MAKLKGGRRQAEGFRCYINFFPNECECLPNPTLLDIEFGYAILVRERE